MRDFTAEDFDDVRRMALHLTGHRPDAPEAYADGLEGMCVAAGSFDATKGPWSAHLGVVVKRHIVEGHRHRATRCRNRPSERSRVYSDTDLDYEPHFDRPRLTTLVGVGPASPEASSTIERTETIHAVRAAVAKLPKGDQEVAWASVSGQQRALAARLGVTEGRISQRRAKVHERLRWMLADVA